MTMTSIKRKQKTSNIWNGEQLASSNARYSSEEGSRKEYMIHFVTLRLFMSSFLYFLPVYCGGNLMILAYKIMLGPSHLGRPRLKFYKFR
ncbi:hypothetical protein CUMW_194710 [Citrus unshiu]|nr:hypothetical protein CUMW_194710 [Citrus unshiu]